MRRRQRIVVHPVGEHGLRVHRAREIPAVRVIGVERHEVDVARRRERSTPLDDGRERHPVPAGDRGPPLDAVVLHRVRDPRHALQLVERQHERRRHEPVHPEPPSVRIPEHRHHRGDEVAGQHRAPLSGAVRACETGGRKQYLLADPVVHPADVEQRRPQGVATVPTARGDEGGRRRTDGELQKPAAVGRLSHGSGTSRGTSR